MKQLLVAFALTLFFSTTGNADLVILNEYNAVGSDRYLETNDFAGSTKTDTTFGRILGNGGNWFELLVLGDAASSTVDMRGWSLKWTEAEEVSPGVNAAGTISLSTDNVWASVQRGTLVTFIETPDGGGVTGLNTATDTSFDGVNDWNMNFSTTEEQANGGTYLTTTTNDGVSGEFSVGNDDWQLTIEDSLGNVISGAMGEGIGSLSGVNSREVGKLEGLEGANATLADWLSLDVTTSTDFNDGTSSSFGQANVFNGGTSTQSFSALRSIPEPSSFVVFGAFALIGTLRRRRN